MSECWHSVKVKELGDVVTGKTPPTNDRDNYGRGYLFIKPPDISAHTRTILTSENKITEAGLATLPDKLLPPKSICVVCIGSIGEKIGLTSVPSVTNQQINSIIVDQSSYNPFFVYYALRNALPQLKKLDSGSASGRENVNKSAFETIKIRIPSLLLQRNIAAILSAYDNLIENNLRRIKILEEMAQNLYTEWFVKFHFPGHEKTKMVDSPLGRIPVGWVVGRLNETFASFTDGDWIETKDQGGQEHRLLQVSNIGIGKFVETRNFRYITQDTFTRLQCQEVIPGDILIARMPKPTGRAWLVTPQPWRMITAVDVAIAKPNISRVNPYFLLYTLNSPQQLALVEQQTTGTTRPRITRIGLASLPIVIPSLVIQNEFGNFSKGLYSFSIYLQNANTNLRRTRDLLLPKLISGELDVSALDIKTGDEE